MPKSQRAIRIDGETAKLVRDAQALLRKETGGELWMADVMNIVLGRTRTMKTQERPKAIIVDEEAARMLEDSRAEMIRKKKIKFTMSDVVRITLERWFERRGETRQEKEERP